jgi:hypothetical protein
MKQSQMSSKVTAMDDLTRKNDNELAEIWHFQKSEIERMEKVLQEHPLYVTAKAIIEEIKRIATQRLQDSGANSIATPNGTIHTVSRTSARIMDPQLFREHVIATGGWDLLDWKANMTACREEMRSKHVPVPGVELSTYTHLNITAPRAPRSQADGE